MAFNYPGPYEIRLFYSTTPVGHPQMTHEQRLNCVVDSSPVPGTDFADITVETRSGANIALDVAVDQWVNLLQPNFHTSSEFVLAELWKYTPDTFDASFISAYEIVEVGTSVGATVVAGQAILSFRTVNGGIMRLNLMESIHAVGQQQTFPTSVVVINDIADAIVASTNEWYARDNSYPISRYKFSPGQNEALFKRRFRGDG